MTRQHTTPPGSGRASDDEQRIALRPLACARLAVDMDAALLPLARDALPLVDADWSGPAHASLIVSTSPVLPAAPPEPAPTLRVRDVAVWIGHGPAGHVLLHAGARVQGSASLAARRAMLRVRDEARVGRATLSTSIGITAALLLGRLGHALLHAGAVVAPDGAAWLLAGTSRSGKSTTCATLIAAGWNWVADDHVLLSADGCVEGWRSDFHIDPGWVRGVRTGERVVHDPIRLGPGRWCRTARLGGMLFPVVRAGEPTRLEPMTHAAAFATLTHQCPWLAADAAAAPALVTLLERATELPRARLVLGADSYARPERLVEVLRSA
ncbi:MAG TPA: hypothetical protein VF041_13610 [Gemmatimonadaceae bacterium]